MPGVGVWTAPRFLIDIGDGARFPSAAHLTAYAGLAPRTRSSGTSIRGEQQSMTGSKQFKRAFFLAAFDVLSDPSSRTYCDKKIKEGQASHPGPPRPGLGRADVLFAILLRDGTFYEQPTPMPLDRSHRGTPGSPTPTRIYGCLLRTPPNRRSSSSSTTGASAST